MDETSSQGSPSCVDRKFPSFPSISERCEGESEWLVSKNIMVIKGLPFTQKSPEGGLFDKND